MFSTIWIKLGNGLQNVLGNKASRKAGEVQAFCVMVKMKLGNEEICTANVLTDGSVSILLALLESGPHQYICDWEYWTGDRNQVSMSVGSLRRLFQNQIKGISGSPVIGSHCFFERYTSAFIFYF